MTLNLVSSKAIPATPKRGCHKIKRHTMRPYGITYTTPTKLYTNGKKT